MRQIQYGAYWGYSLPSIDHVLGPNFCFPPPPSSREKCQNLELKGQKIPAPSASEKYLHVPFFHHLWKFQEKLFFRKHKKCQNYIPNFFFYIRFFEKNPKIRKNVKGRLHRRIRAFRAQKFCYPNPHLSGRNLATLTHPPQQDREVKTPPWKVVAKTLVLTKQPKTCPAIFWWLRKSFKGKTQEEGHTNSKNLELLGT